VEKDFEKHYYRNNYDKCDQMEKKINKVEIGIDLDIKY
jgi:hypothetical protein